MKRVAPDGAAVVATPTHWKFVFLSVSVQQWYTSTMNLVGTWLTDRMDLQLHLYQLKILIRIVKVRAHLLHGCC